MNGKQMCCCNEYWVQLTLYLDGELDNTEKSIIEAHLKDCRNCRDTFNRERWFLKCLQRTAPLYVVSDELRTKTTGIFEQAPPKANLSPVQLPSQGVWSWFNGFQWSAKRGISTALTGLLVIMALWGMVHLIDPKQSLTFAAVAVDVHQRHTLGHLPMELISNSPDKISHWFEGKVLFSLKLPNYQEASGQDKLYQLKGARLIGFKNDYAAYVAYQMEQSPISLIVTSSTNAVPEGGEKIASRGLIVHYETIAGLKVITWTHRGLTYALVSNLEERGQQSCLVCHQGTKDKDFISDFNPLGLSG